MQRSVIHDKDLEQLQQLYRQGLYLQAYAQAQTYGPLCTWRGLEPRLIAARLAGCLGDPRLSNALFFLAWREHRGDARAIVSYARSLLARRGPYETWRFLQRHTGVQPEGAVMQSEWLALHAQVLASLRDFGRAEEWWSKAEATAPDHYWVWIERVTVLAMQDRWSEALAAARRVLELRPGCRAGVEATAHALEQNGQIEEAIALLRSAAQRLESGQITVRLVVLLCERRLWDEAGEAVERTAVLFPLLRGKGVEWLEVMRSDIAYHRGDRAKAIEHARLAPSSGFLKEIAERLARHGHDRRAVLLDVPYVHQHYRTCAPATLASIGRYWSIPVDHLQLVESICYDGTPDHKERHWAESSGWVAREFSVTWEAALALLDRGVPFTLTTVQPTTAHLQAVIGYDAARGTFFVRDPGGSVRGEYLAPELLAAQRTTGPRGMALVPTAEAVRLEGVELPEADLYDHLYTLKRALERNDRQAAWQEYEWLAGQYPGHAFVHRARWVIADYDDDRPAVLGCIERLLELFPGDQVLSLRRLVVLRELGRQEDRMRLLRDMCARRDADPIFWLEYGEELRVDARRWAEAEHTMRRVMRLRPQDARVYGAMAALRLDQRCFDEALELQRFAACLAPTDEQFSQRYATLARLLKRNDEALSFLRERLQRLGRQSSSPAMTLYAALANLGQQAEAFQVLDEAIERCREDDTAVLFAAQEAARFGNRQRAEVLLASSQANAHRNSWLRTSARVAETQGDLKRAEELWRELLLIERSSVDAHQALAALIARTKGTADARLYLAEVVTRLPHHLGIQHLYAEWLRGGDPAERERALETILAHHPTDAWTWRELAVALAGQQRCEEARTKADEALRLDPNSADSHAVSGWVSRAAGVEDEARSAFRTAISLSVNNVASFEALMNLCGTREQAVEALRSFARELERQTVLGDALKAYREAAQAVLPATEVLDLLRAALAARPDLPQAWSEAIEQLLSMERVDQAAALCEQANRLFPLSADLWVHRAKVEQSRGDRPGRLEALERAVAIAPTWDWAARELGNEYQNAGNLNSAQQVLEVALSRNRRDPANHGYLADALWAKGDQSAACELLRQALRLEPSYNWAWQRLRQWLTQLGRPEELEALARQITEERAGETAAWLALARELQGADKTNEKLVALDRALQLNPRSVEAHDLRATVLALSGQVEEALAACAPQIFGNVAPMELQIRSAWIEHRRGNRSEAIERIKTVLENHPSHLWGWQQLADWAEEAGELDVALKAAEKMVQLDSANARTWGYLGGARLAMGDRDGARRALRRAVELDPMYAWAGLSLLDLELLEGNFEGAAAAYDDLSRHQADDTVLGRGVRVAAGLRDKAMALERFRQQCDLAAEDASLNVSFADLQSRGWYDAADAVLDEAIAAERPPARVAALWVRRCVARKRWRLCEQELARLADHPGTGERAIWEYVSALSEAKDRRRLVMLGTKHRDLLSAYTSAWGCYGAALLGLRNQHDCAVWLKDWRERKDVAVWMLSNLIISLRHIDNWAEARAVALHAEPLATPQEAHELAVWLAVDDALANETEQLERRLAVIPPDGLRPYYRCLYEVASGIHEVGRTDPERNNRVFEAARQNISRALWAVPAYSYEQGLILAVQRAARCITDICGGVRPWLWSWRCRLTP